MFSLTPETTQHRKAYNLENQMLEHTIQLLAA